MTNQWSDCDNRLPHGAAGGFRKVLREMPFMSPLGKRVRYTGGVARYILAAAIFCIFKPVDHDSVCIVFQSRTGTVRCVEALVNRPFVVVPVLGQMPSRDKLTA